MTTLAPDTPRHCYTCTCDKECKHFEDNGHWKQVAIWVCDDCGKELKPHYHCGNCESDEWISCEVKES